MNAAQPNAPTSPAATEAAPPADAAPTSLEERAAKVYEAIRNERPAAPAAEPAADPTQEAAAAPVDPAKRAEERRARLAQLASEDRERIDHKAKLAQNDKLARELEQERAARAELEKRLSGRIDPNELDEARFFELAARAKVDPTKLGAFLKERIANPEIIAAREAQRAVDPKIAALEARLEAQDKALRDYMQREENARQAQADERAQREWLHSVSQADEHAPLASQFLKVHGEAEFLKVVNAAARDLPAGAGGQALLDKVEEFLDTDGRAYAQHLATLYGLLPAVTPSQGKAPPARAAAKATTVSNSHAAQRASVVDEDDFASLPLDERARRIAARIG